MKSYRRKGSSSWKIRLHRGKWPRGDARGDQQEGEKVVYKVEDVVESRAALRRNWEAPGGASKLPKSRILIDRKRSIPISSVYRRYIAPCHHPMYRRSMYSAWSSDRLSVHVTKPLKWDGELKKWRLGALYRPLYRRKERQFPISACGIKI